MRTIGASLMIMGASALALVAIGIPDRGAMWIGIFLGAGYIIWRIKRYSERFQGVRKDRVQPGPQRERMSAAPPNRDSYTNTMEDIAPLIREWLPGRSAEAKASLVGRLNTESDPLRWLARQVELHQGDQDGGYLTFAAAEAIFRLQEDGVYAPLPDAELMQVAKVSGEVALRENQPGMIVKSLNRSIRFSGRDWNNPISSRLREAMRELGLLDRTAVDFTRVGQAIVDRPVAMAHGTPFGPGNGLEEVGELLRAEIPDVEHRRSVGRRFQTSLALAIREGKVTMSDVQAAMGLGDSVSVDDRNLRDSRHMGGRVIRELEAAVNEDAVEMAKGPLQMGDVAVTDTTSFYLVAYYRLFNASVLKDVIL